jgi:ketosteroid isomerase-like protein
MMKRILLFVFVTFSALAFAACGGTAENKPANIANTANANAAKPAAAAPTADALLALDKQLSEAWIKGDTKVFETMLSDKFVSFDSGIRYSKAEIVKMIGETKCEVKDWKLEDPQMSMVDADTYVISYKGTFDGSCTGKDGKSMKIPSPTRAASVFVRSGDKWVGAFHGENVIIDPKNPPAPPAADKKAEPKKEEAKKEEPKKDDKAPAIANTAAVPAKPTADANTDALVKIHSAGWEAFKAKDAKKFEEMSTANLSIVDPMGTWMSGKAAVIKHWTETMKCEGITKTSVSDGFASAISPTVELLTLKGSSDGTCDGQKNGPLWQTAIYVKEGDAWKLAFMFEALAM